jgi:hypothetical protein
MSDVMKLLARHKRCRAYIEESLQGTNMGAIAERQRHAANVFMSQTSTTVLSMAGNGIELYIYAQNEA